MSFANRLLIILVQGLTRLYPVEFQNQFRDEILQVMTEMVQDPDSQDTPTLLRASWRELRDWPASLILQYWNTWQQRKVSMSRVVEIPQEIAGKVKSPASRPEAGGWVGACLAGLPHLLFSLLIGGGNLVYQGLPGMVDPGLQRLMVVLGLGFFGLVVVVLVYSRQHGWPVWSASWYPYGLWLGLILLELVNMSLGLTDNWKFNLAFILGGVGVLVIGYVWLFRRSPLKSFLTVFFLMPIFMLINLEFIPPNVEGWLYVSTGLLIAAAAFWIVRPNNTLAGLVLVAGCGLLTSLAIAYVSVYLIELPQGAPHIPTIGEFGLNLAVYGGVSAILIGGPKVLWSGWDFFRRVRLV